MDEITRRQSLGTLVVGASAVAAGCASKVEPKEAPVVKKDEKHLEQAEVVTGTVPLSFPWQTRDPFLFCVHHEDFYPAGNEKFGPAASLVGRRLGMDFEIRDGWRMYHGQVVPGFPAHPHRGFETVTVVRKGLIDHADSMGAAARYGNGDVQWLTAGKGIQHAEMFPLLDQANPNTTELFQIWLNLPKANKFVEPHFTMLWNHQVPRHDAVDDQGRKTHVEVVAGQLADDMPASPPPDSYASRPDADVAIWTLKMEPGARFTLPPAKKGSNRSLYFFVGDTLRIGARALKKGVRADLVADQPALLVAGDAEVEALVLQGRPIGEPVVQHGPFVMNTRDEIRQAYQDYQRTRFGGWPWDRSDPVHARKRRFAKHADGRVEEPA